MTFIEAAIEILKQNGNQPLSSKEIWKKISEQNLVKTNGKTPWASLNTILIFNKHGRMLFSYDKKKELDISEKMMLDII